MLPSYMSPEIPGTSADLRNINSLLNPAFNTFETETNAAENAVAGGMSGSSWAGNVRSNMLDSERIKRMTLGNQMLEPYLNRESQSADRAQRMQLAVLEGNQAMERLRLSESGETARLTQSERARLEQIAAQGRISMQELLTREAGETGRQETQIRGQLANTMLSQSLKPGATAVTGSTGSELRDNWANHPNFLNYPSNTGSGTRPGVGSSGIDRILQQYGLN